MEVNRDYLGWGGQNEGIIDKIGMQCKKMAAKMTVHVCQQFCAQCS